jgi:hypothetical protein
MGAGSFRAQECARHTKGGEQDALGTPRLATLAQDRRPALHVCYTLAYLSLAGGVITQPDSGYCFFVAGFWV